MNITETTIKVNLDTTEAEAKLAALDAALDERSQRLDIQFQRLSIMDEYQKTIDRPLKASVVTKASEVIVDASPSPQHVSKTKYQLEHDIEKLLYDFQEKTGLMPRDVILSTMDISKITQPRQVKISVRVILG